MSDPRIPLKNPWLAAFLAYVLPGAGHFYQGRLIKGAIYSICILGMFLHGMALSDWTALHSYDYQYDNRQPPAGWIVNWPGEQTVEWPGGRIIERRNWGFLAQVGIGAPAVLALVQTARFQSASNNPITQLEQPLSSDFDGRFRKTDGEVVNVTGRVELKPVRTELGSDVAGTFVGTAREEDGTERRLELQLGGGMLLGRPVAGTRQRDLVVRAIAGEDGRASRVGTLHGEIERRFANRVGAPVPEKRLQKLHGHLGKSFELALIYTWIAGLLNILAVWDAFEGPAYGYGDEESTDQANLADSKQPAAAGPADEKQPPNPQRHAAAAESTHHTAGAD